MEPYGYNRGLTIGALAAGSMLGIMFMAGLVPGLMGLKPLLTVAGETIAGKEKLALSAVVFFMLMAPRSWATSSRCHGSHFEQRHAHLHEPGRDSRGAGILLLYFVLEIFMDAIVMLAGTVPVVFPIR